MLNKIKLGLLIWSAITLVILFFVTIGVWIACSAWWLITNNMVDRNIFLLICLGTTFLISIGSLFLGMLPEKK